MAKIFIVGNIGKDPELKIVKTKDGRDAHCVNFSIADNTKVKGADGKWEKHTDWYKVCIWDKQAENFVKYCKKGKQLEICGILKRVEYTDKDGVKVRDIEIKPLTIDYGPDSRKNSTYEGQNTGEAAPAHATPPPATPPAPAAPALPPAPTGYSWAFMNNTHVLIPTPAAAPAPVAAQAGMVVIDGV
jgi:single-strand DNA-binding protein